LPAQHLVERSLDPALADLVAELVAAQLLELRPRDLADVAHELSREVAVAVLPDVRVRDLDARKLRLVLVEVPDLTLGGELLHGHRCDGVAAVLLDLASHLGQRNVQDPREAPQLLILPLLRKVGRPHADGGPALVVDEHHAKAVLDRAAWRL
jgi:hypothetical protein